MTVSLPTGRRGQCLAVGLTLLVVAAFWAAVIRPLVSWYAERNDWLTERHAYAQRMVALVATLPDLRRQSSATQPAGPAPQLLLDGRSDAVAGARLQETVQQLASEAGASLTSVETLPAELAGAWRRIGVRVVLSAPWPVLVHLLQAVARGTPRMLADDLQLQASTLVAHPETQPLDASFTIFAFRAGTAAAGAEAVR
jgi:general secretion pathway protein M